MLVGAWEPGSVSNLQTTPLVWWLAAAVDRRFTGTLVLQEAEGKKHGVFLERGAPRKARTAFPVVHLGDVLVERGVLDRGTCEETLARALEARRLHGELLRTEGKLDVAVLRDALTEQLRRQLAFLFDCPDTTRVCYFEGENYLDRWGAESQVKLNPLPLVFERIREAARPESIELLLAELGDSAFALRTDAPVDDFHLVGSYRVVADVLRGGRMRVRDLLQGGLGPEPEVRRAVYLLAITGCLELAQVSSRPPAPLSKAPAPASAKSPPPSSPATAASSSIPPPISSGRRSGIPPASAALVDVLEEIRRRLEHKRANYYGVLGVEVNATGADIRAAFTPLAKRFHPDSLTRSVPEARELAPQLFAQIMEAFRVLSDPFRRAEYDRDLRAGNAPEVDLEPLRRLYRGMVRPHRAEALLTAGNVEAADQEVRRALDASPDEPELLALSALIQAQKPDANTRQLWALIDAAENRAPSNPKVHYYRGLFLQRLGKHASALQEFRQVVELDPHHIDAARQVRLYEKTRDQWMTESSPPPSAATSTSGTFPRVSTDRLRAWLRGRKS